MSDWQERITHETAPAIRAEHELRYSLAAPLILAADSWADLGCGTGLAAAAALGEQRPEHALLADVEEQAVAAAAAALGIPEARALVCDLTDPTDLERLERELLGFPGEPVLTCFEVVEHLSRFTPLLHWAKRLAAEHAATVVLSVPNDAFWSIQNPHHRTIWSEGAFEELRGLLPAEHTLVRQVALSGSAAVAWDAQSETRELSVQTGGDGTVATHFIAAFGPGQTRMRRTAVAVQTDLLGQRRWERQRESDAAVAQRDVAVAERAAQSQRAAVEAQDATIAKQREELRDLTAQFDDWRAYIHELERELGRPLSGQGDAAAADHAAEAGEERAREPRSPTPDPASSQAEAAEPPT